MNKNSGLKVLTVTIVAITILIIGIKINTQEDKPQESNDSQISQSISTQFNDNLRDVAARLQETEKKLKNLAEENQYLKNIPATTIQSESSDLLNSAITQLKKEIAELKSNPREVNYNAPKPSVVDVDLWLEKNQLITLPEKKEEQVDSNPVTPFYTIPAGTDLTDIRLHSALIGEVPTEGKLLQPLFPFSASIGNGVVATANRISLPQEITGMKINGYAIGVGSFLDNISCVRAYITSALFVFEDGHFVTIGAEQVRNSAELVNNESLGYLTTHDGNPCIKGKYLTNAPKVISTLMASSGIQGAGSALSQWQARLFGDTGNMAMGGALNQGSVKSSEWLEKRIQGSFDMVYVPQSRNKNLSLHITKTIPIDKEQNGRVLDYGNQLPSHFDHNLR